MYVRAVFFISQAAPDLLRLWAVVPKSLLYLGHEDADGHVQPPKKFEDGTEPGISCPPLQFGDILLVGMGVPSKLLLR